MLFAILAAAILVGQGVKSWIKDKVQEPRPFVIWLEKHIIFRLMSSTL